MKISIVAALDEHGVIGRAGGLPWRLPDDQQFFKRLTTGHCIAMGRKTFDSIGRPLPERTCIVISRNRAWKAEGAVAVGDFESALAEARARGESELFVVGGAQIYALALPRAQQLFLTRVHARVDGDLRFPEFDESDWKLLRETLHPADPRHEHAFTIREYQRR